MTDLELTFQLRFSLHKRVEWPAEDDYARISQIYGVEADRVASIDAQFQKTVADAARRLRSEFDPRMFAGAQARLVFVGDSNTSCRTGYRAIVTEYLRESGVICVDKSVSCEKSTEAVFEFQGRVLDQSPDWVSILIGSNGVRRADFPGSGPIVSHSDFRGHLHVMLTQLEKAGAKAILHTLPPMQPALLEVNSRGQTVSLEDIAVCNETIRSAARKFGCPLNDAADALGDGTQTLAGDGIHLNDAGQLTMARGLLAQLSALLGAK